jgi:hypothetical protein
MRAAVYDMPNITDKRGTPASIAECRSRLRLAIARSQAEIDAENAARIALYGACSICATPYENDSDPKCIPLEEGGLD